MGKLPDPWHKLVFKKIEPKKPPEPKKPIEPKKSESKKSESKKSDGLSERKKEKKKLKMEKKVGNIFLLFLFFLGRNLTPFLLTLLSWLVFIKFMCRKVDFMSFA